MQEQLPRERGYKYNCLFIFPLPVLPPEGEGTHFLSHSINRTVKNLVHLFAMHQQASIKTKYQ